MKELNEFLQDILDDPTLREKHQRRPIVQFLGRDFRRRRPAKASNVMQKRDNVPLAADGSQSNRHLAPNAAGGRHIERSRPLPPQPNEHIGVNIQRSASVGTDAISGSHVAAVPRGIDNGNGGGSKPEPKRTGGYSRDKYVTWVWVWVLHCLCILGLWQDLGLGLM